MKILKVLILSIVLVSISMISPNLKVEAEKIAGKDESINVIVAGKYLLTEGEESGNTLLYLRNTKDGEVSIKLELGFDDKGNINHYRFKNYSYEIRSEGSKKLTREEGLELANRFMKEFIGKDLELKHIADIYPSLYEEGIHETYGDRQGKYTMVIYLENGFIEYFSVNK